MCISILRRALPLAALTALALACGSSGGAPSSSSGASGGADTDASAASDASDASAGTPPAPTTFLAVCQLIQQVDMQGMLHLFGEATYGPVDAKTGKSTEMQLTLSPLALWTSTLDESVRVGTPIALPKGPFTPDGVYHESVGAVTIAKQAAATGKAETFSQFDARLRNAGGVLNLCLNVALGSRPSEAITCAVVPAKPTDSYTGGHDHIQVGDVVGLMVFDGKPCN